MVVTRSTLQVSFMREDSTLQAVCSTQVVVQSARKSSLHVTAVSGNFVPHEAFGVTSPFVCPHEVNAIIIPISGQVMCDARDHEHIFYEMCLMRIVYH